MLLESVAIALASQIQPIASSNSRRVEAKDYPGNKSDGRQHKNQKQEQGPPHEQAPKTTEPEVFEKTQEFSDIEELTLATLEEKKSVHPDHVHQASNITSGLPTETLETPFDAQNEKESSDKQEQSPIPPAEKPADSVIFLETRAENDQSLMELSAHAKGELAYREAMLRQKKNGTIAAGTIIDSEAA